MYSCVLCFLHLKTLTNNKYHAAEVILFVCDCECEAFFSTSKYSKEDIYWAIKVSQVTWVDAYPLFYIHHELVFTRNESVCGKQFTDESLNNVCII